MHSFKYTWWIDLTQFIFLKEKKELKVHLQDFALEEELRNFS